MSTVPDPVSVGRSTMHDLGSEPVPLVQHIVPEKLNVPRWFPGPSSMAIFGPILNAGLAFGGQPPFALV